MSKSLSFCVAGVGVLLVAAVVEHAAAQELVTNGGFETGDFTGWTPSGDTSWDGVDSYSARSGNFGAYFGPVFHLGGWEQTLAADAGDPLILDFWLHVDEDTPNHFDVSLGGVTLLSRNNLPPAVYDHYTFPILSPVNDPVLRFQFRHDPAYFYLDDISVVPDALPCPGDLNGDGAVGLQDLTLLLAHFGTPSGATYDDGDLDADGDVDLSDLTLLLANFGTICP